MEAVLILAKQRLAQDRFSKELCKKQVCYGNTIRNWSDRCTCKTDISTRNVCKTAVAQDKFVMKAVTILTLVEQIEFVDAFAKQHSH